MSSTQNEEALISQFIDVTGANSERSRFFLEASGWDVQVAIASYFEGEQSDQEQDDEPSVQPPRSSDAPNLAAQLNQGAPRPVAEQQKPKSVAKADGGPVTLDSIRQQENNSDEEEKGQAFFAGGSMTSGQQVLGPSKKKDEFIKDLFEKAREHGATSEDPTTPNKPQPSFGGTGYKLGDSASGAAQEVASSAFPSSVDVEPREVILRLWSTGFTVDDGELRLYSDPNNVEFLNTIKRGEIPRELVRTHSGQEVQLAMEDRRHEPYVKPKAALNPFSGQGHMLGSPSPTVVSSATPLGDTNRTKNEEKARSQIIITENEPTTNIQLRLVDGTRLIARFNHTHRVSDLHNFINTARPEFATTNYTLTLFPNRELTDMDSTIKDANVLSAALIQKIK